MLESWRPGGVPQEAAIPVVSVNAGTVEIKCDTAGSTVGWTTTPPTEVQAPPPHLKAMGVELDGRAWRLYTGLFALEPDTQLYVKAWRMGFDPSEEVAIVPARV